MKVLMLISGLMLCTLACAQKKKLSMKDSLDGKLDMSDYIIDAHGFVPVPMIITEPALGGFGAALAPVFLRKRPPFIDSVKGERKISPVPPDITGAMALYTINGTWMTGAFRSGTFVKSRIKYRIAAAYGDINMSFYKTLPTLGEQEFKASIKTIPVLVSAIKRVSVSNWFAGLQYLYMHSEVSGDGSNALPSFVKPVEVKSDVGVLSGILEFDNRDNVFTPDKGLKFHIDGGYSDNAFASDYNFWKLNYYMFLYAHVSDKITGGWRIDGQQILGGDPPFYFLPFITMRGVPAARYQGRADVLTELELRYDVVRRWSIVAFGGTGKAFDDWSAFGEASWIFSGGAGFRYLLARKFKLRMGIDLARGPETWAYYIVFGSNWIK